MILSREKYKKIYLDFYKINFYIDREIKMSQIENNKMKPITVMIPSELHRKLKLICVIKGWSMKSVTIEQVEKLVVENEHLITNKT